MERRQMSELENDLEKVMKDLATAESKPPHRPQVVPAPQREATLTEQLERMEMIRRQLHEKLQRDKMELQHNYDRRWQATKQEYAKRAMEAVTKLEQERDEVLRGIANEYHTKSREHDALLARMEE
jgi:hypothetical protein